MSNTQLSLTFLGRFIRERTSDFLMIWLVSALFLLIPSIIFWATQGGIVSSQVMISEIFEFGSTQIKAGVPFLQAIPPAMWRTLTIIISLNVLSFLVVFSFIQGGIANYLTQKESNSKSAISQFLKAGWKNLCRMMGVNLMIAVILLLSFAVGFGLGALVYVVAGLLIFIILVVVVLYIYIRFAFTPFCVVVEKISWFSALGSSMDKTKMFTGIVAGIVIVTAIMTKVFFNLTGNLPFVTELISSLILIFQLTLLTPLYLKAVK
jgi:hypothetical protein